MAAAFICAVVFGTTCKSGLRLRGEYTVDLQSKSCSGFHNPGTGKNVSEGCCAALIFPYKVLSVSTGSGMKIYAGGGGGPAVLTEVSGSTF